MARLRVVHSEELIPSDELLVEDILSGLEEELQNSDSELVDDWWPQRSSGEALCHIP
jgi:hypothetical protein